jgi:2-dehydropantoate 2-reductase
VKIAVVGAGGVGGYFGARLAKGGADVTFVARGAHLAAIRERGLAIEGGPAEFRVSPVRAVENPAMIGVVDIVLLAVKMWDSEAAIAAIKPIVGSETAVISLQNGVVKDQYLRRAFGPANVLGGVCYVATYIAGPGVIGRTGPLERLVIGEFDGSPSARATRFVEVCRNCGINAELSRNISRDIWEKFVFLVALSGTTTTMRSPIGPIRANPQTRAFFRDVMREVVAVGRASGIELPEDYAEQRVNLADTVAEDMTSSMHHDLERGNRLEVRWLSGSVVELGHAVGIATPLNRAIADILALHADGGSRPAASTQKA